MSSTNNSKGSQSSSSSLAKEIQEIIALKQYIESCPKNNKNASIPPNSNAIRIALHALNEQLQKLNRDDKLRRKFSCGTRSNSGGGSTTTSSNSDEEEDMVKVSTMELNRERGDDRDATVTVKANTNSNVNANMDAEEEVDEWQQVKVNPNPNTNQAPDTNIAMSMDDAPPSNTRSANQNHNNSGERTTITSKDAAEEDMTMDNDDDNNHKEDKQQQQEEDEAESILAQVAIHDMSNANVTVTSPIAALALVLHSLLRSDILAFKCTGVPDDENCFKEKSTVSSSSSSASSVSAGPAKKKKTNGFAAPVRELARGVFLPKKWDQYASSYYTSGPHRVLLRYRKNGMPATILRVEQLQSPVTDNMNMSDSDAIVSSNENNEIMARVNFGAAGGEPSEMIFPLSQHVNLDGLQLALSSSSSGSSGKGVKPSLHYKALAALVTKFCHVNDLGAVRDGNDVSGADLSSMAMPYVSQLPVSLDQVQVQVQKPSTGAGMNSGVGTRYTGSHPPTIRDDLLGINSNNNRLHPGYPINNNYPAGDFAGDLLPSGLPAPGFADPLGGGIHGGLGGVGGTGNLMGPNHPAFHPQFHNGDDEMNGNGDFMTPGGLGMQPRFDPYYPPGVGGRGFGRGGRGGRGRGRGRGRGGRFSSGNPNPDHQRPPNNFGNDMFM